jgi:hypothetical protein
MTPSKYKARYWDMSVYTQWGATTPVSVNQYRLNAPGIGNVNHKMMDAFMQHWRKGIDPKLDIRVDTGAEIVRVSQETLKAWGGFIRYAFLGKASPELHQVVLQLAVYWGLASYDSLQKYADDALGLDCNGFVGNYCWHVKHNHAWTELGYRKGELGADTLIDQYLQPNIVKRWQDIDVAKTYVLALVDGSGNVIPGGGTVGHVMITEPNRSIPIAYPKPSTRPDNSALWVVESTAAHRPGLVESWYHTNNLVGPVFSVNRNAMSRAQQMPVKIAELR